MSADRGRLASARLYLTTAGLRWFEKARRVQRWLHIVGVLGGSAIAAIGGGMDGPMRPQDGSTLLTDKGEWIVAGVLIVLLASAFVYYLQEEAPRLLLRAMRLERDAQALLDQHDDMRAEADRLAELDVRRLAMIDGGTALAETLEQCLLIDPMNDAVAIQTMMDAAQLYLCASIGFVAGEAWAISVFRIRSSGGPARLHRIAALRAETLDPRKEARSWGLNEGFVGAAWASNRDVIVDDAHDPRVIKDYPVPADLVRDYDAGRYRSMAAIPIRVGDGKKVWGVVAASSDCRARFHRDDGNREKQAVDTVRLLARMTALMAAALDRSKS